MSVMNLVPCVYATQQWTIVMFIW